MMLTLCTRSLAMCAALHTGRIDDAAQAGKKAVRLKSAASDWSKVECLLVDLNLLLEADLGDRNERLRSGASSLHFYTNGRVVRYRISQSLLSCDAARWRSADCVFDRGQARPDVDFSSSYAIRNIRVIDVLKVIEFVEA